MFAQARVFATTVAPRARMAQKMNTTTRGAASDNWFPGTTPWIDDDDDDDDDDDVAGCGSMMMMMMTSMDAY